MTRGRNRVKREIVAKALAMTVTMSFMALVRTDAEPKLWQTAMIALGLYESIVMAIKILMKGNRKYRRKKMIRIQQQDARRWAEEWFNPLREVI